MLAMSRIVALLMAVTALLYTPSVSAQTNYTGTFTAIPIPSGATACPNARGLAVDNSGNIYIACGTNSTILVLNSAGAQQRTIKSPAASGLWSPFGIAFASGQASMYVTSLWENVVYQVNTTSGALVTSWTTSLNNPWGIAVDGSGNVVVANYGAGNVLKFSSTGSLLQTYTATPAMQDPEEVAFDQSGNILVVDTDGDRIVKFSTSGNQMAVYNQTTPALNEPGGIAVDSNGNIYVCDTWNYAVLKLNSNGQQIATLSSPNNDGTVKISAAAGLTLDNNNQLYVLDSLTNNRILKFPAMTGGASAVTVSFSLIAALVAALMMVL